MNFGLEQEGGRLITPMALAHPLHPSNTRSRNKRRNLWVGRCVPSWRPLLPSRNSVSIYIYLYVCILYTSSGYRTYIYTYTGSVVRYWWSYTPSQSIGLVLGSALFLCWMPLVVFFGFTNCVFLFANKTNTKMLVATAIRFKQNLTLGILRFAISHPGMFLSLDLLSEYQIHHGAIGLLYVTARYSTKIFYRGVSRFAIDCPCGVWCRGLTTCLLFVGPFFLNRLLNNSWAVGLT